MARGFDTSFFTFAYVTFASRNASSEKAKGRKELGMRDETELSPSRVVCVVTAATKNSPNKFILYWQVTLNR